jgi:hypothetical protein
MPSGGQKAASTCDQGVNARQIPREVAKLLLDGLAYLVDTRSLLLGHCQKLVARLLLVRTWLMTKAFSGLRRHCIDQDLSQLPCFIE